MKNTFTLLFVLLTVISVNAQILKGDMNGDGKITIADANEIVNTSLGKTSVQEIQLSDVFQTIKSEESALSNQMIKVYNSNGSVKYIPLSNLSNIKYLSNVNPNQPRLLITEVKQEEVEEGTNLILHIVAESMSPIRFFSNNLYGPNGNIHGGGCGIVFTETSPGIYEYTQTDLISKYMPNGRYYYDMVSVENEGNYKSENWEGDVSVNITTHNISSTKPIIQDVSVNQEEVSGGTNLVFKIRVMSDTPIRFFSSCLWGPNGNIYGGGVGVPFTEVSSGIYEYTQTDFISKYMPNGEYYYDMISVENEARFESEMWPSKVQTYITNHTAAVTNPVIKDVQLSQQKVSNGTCLNLKITATSDAPVNWLNLCLYGPNGNIYGGGGEVYFTEVSTGVYEYIVRDFISNANPRGKYYYDMLSVRNEGRLESAQWKGALSITLQ